MLVKRLFNLLAIASLVLFLAAAGLWLRSHSIRDGLYFHAGGWLWTINSASGALTVGYYRNGPGKPLLHHCASDLGERFPADFEWLPSLDTVFWSRGPFEGSHGYNRIRVRGGDVLWEPPVPKGQTELTDADLSPTLKFARTSMPYWFVAALLAPVPISKFIAMMVRSATRRARVAHGLCVGCGYDVRASSARCPECGLSLAGFRGGVAEA